MAETYAAWLDRMAAQGRVSLDGLDGGPRDVAATMLAALHGLKQPRPDYDAYRASVARLAALFGRALTR